MNATTAALNSANSSQFGKLAGGSIAALAMLSIVSGLFYVTGLKAQSVPVANSSPQHRPVSYFPAQFELKPAATEAPVFEY